MRMMTKCCPAEGKADSIALLSRMQSSLTQWLAMPPALVPYPVSCRAWCAQLHEVACHARSAGLHAYSSLSVRIGEQLEPSFRSDDTPRSAVQLLLRWLQASLRYLRQSADFRNAAELVGVLGMSYANHYGAEERACLLGNLIEDYESSAHRCTQSKPSLGSAGTP